MGFLTLVNNTLLYCIYNSLWTWSVGDRLSRRPYRSCLWWAQVIKPAGFNDAARKKSYYSFDNKWPDLSSKWAFKCFFSTFSLTLRLHSITINILLHYMHHYMHHWKCRSSHFAISEKHTHNNNSNYNISTGKERGCLLMLGQQV